MSAKNPIGTLIQKILNQSEKLLYFYIYFISTNNKDNRNARLDS